MKFTLNIWRQKGPDEKGRFVTYEARDMSSSMSFWKCWTVSIRSSIAAGEEPVAFE